MSEIKVNKITPRTDCGTTTLGDSGDSITVGGDLKSNALKATDGGSIISQSGTTITLGASGDTITLASGASQSGFGRSGSVNWQTSIKTANFTAASGEGYFCNTTSGAFTVTLPASPSSGDIVALKDYANTFDTANLTIGRNGSNIGGAAQDAVLATEGLAVTLVYSDATKGWLVTESGLQSEAPGPQFVAASGGTETTSGDFKIHKFTGPGTFTVSNAGNAAGSNTLDYLVVAGGGGGENTNGAGGGAGGYRFSNGTASGSYCAGPSPLGASGITVSATAIPITVGAGGTAGTPSPPAGGAGSDSTFSTITSAGGGGGGQARPGNRCGGSGAGGPHGTTGGPGALPTVGLGNTPPVSPPQGNPGGTGIDNKAGPAGTKRGGSGGGAGAVGGSRLAPGGSNTQNPAPEQAGGAGLTSSIDGTPTARGGGGGGGSEESSGAPVTAAAGGSGGGGSGGVDPSGTNATAGTANTGGGGGGGGDLSPNTGKAGGSGIVIIRYKFQ
tara:strand:- start:26 stop:1528 length:1503 start_codon:yes stop_codon:yes gene_type:complete